MTGWVRQLLELEEILKRKCTDSNNLELLEKRAKLLEKNAEVLSNAEEYYVEARGNTTPTKKNTEKASANQEITAGRTSPVFPHCRTNYVKQYKKRLNRSIPIADRDNN